MFLACIVVTLDYEPIIAAVSPWMVECDDYLYIFYTIRADPVCGLIVRNSQRLPDVIFQIGDNMAGHSKWANIKFRKAAQDARRGKVFTKLIKEITVSTRIGGSDPNANPRLRAAIDKALGSNMTRDTIERAVKRGAGETDGADIEEIRYEGYGPNGVAMLVEIATDNRNRTVSEVRHSFTKHGGNLGTEGSVAYLFNKVGSIVFTGDQDEEQIMEIAMEAGAEDIESDEDVIEVVTPPESLHEVTRAFVQAGMEPEMAELIQRPSVETEVEGEDAEKIMKIIDALEDLDDVQNVFTNAIFVESV